MWNWWPLILLSPWLMSQTLSTALEPHGLQRMIRTHQRHPPQLAGASWTGRSQPPQKAHGGLETSRVLRGVLLKKKTPSAWTKWTLCGLFLPLACLSPHAVSNQYHTSSSFENLCFLPSVLTGTFPKKQDNIIFPLWLSIFCLQLSGAHHTKLRSDLCGLKAKMESYIEY